MPQCHVPWGPDTLTLSLPEAWRIQQQARPMLPAAGKDWPERLAMALSRPEGAVPLPQVLAGLAKDARIELIVEDITRHSPLAEILPRIVRELEHAGVGDEQVGILFATGMHPDMTEQEARQKVGDLVDRFEWRCNQAADKSAHEEVGAAPLPFGDGTIPILMNRHVLQADLRIVISSVSPHLQAGFGGGAKMFLPGCAALETIARAHACSLPKTMRRPLVGQPWDVNPMRGIIDLAGELVDQAGGVTFAVQYMLDAEDKPASIVAGGLRHGQRLLAKQCAAAAGIVIDQTADVLITNAWPRDHDLWQSFKCIPNTCGAVRPGGAIVVLARCPAGANMGEVRWPLSPRWTRRLIRWIGPKGIISLAKRLAPGMHGEAHFFIRLAVETIHRNPVYMYAPELIRRGQRFPGLPVYDDLDALLRDVERDLGTGAKRTLVFEAGGASYPVLTE